jgi:hypothetical protein
MSETITTDENDEEIVNAIIEILQLPSFYQRSNESLPIIIFNDHIILVAL